MTNRGPSSLSDSYNIESNSIHSKLFKNIIESDDLLDAFLSVEGQKIKVHRVILSAGSKYFRNILKDFHCYNTVPIFVFTDIKAFHLLEIVKFLYTGKIQVPAKEMDEFLSVASKLEVLGLHGDKDVESENVSDVSMTAEAEVMQPDNNGNRRVTPNIHPVSQTEHSMQSTSNSDEQNVQHLKRTHNGIKKGADFSKNSNQIPINTVNQEKRTRMNIDANTTVELIPQFLHNTSTISPISTLNLRIDNGNGQTTNNTCTEQTNQNYREQLRVTNVTQFSPNNNRPQYSPTKRITTKPHTSPTKRAQLSPTKRLQLSPSKRPSKHRLHPSPNNRSDNGSSSNTGRYRCDTCLRLFDTSQHLLRHKKYKCGKTKRFHCHMCTRSFYLRIGIRNHYKLSKCKPKDGCNPDGEVDSDD